MRKTKHITLAAMLIGLLALLQIFNNFFGQVLTNFAPFVYPFIFIIYASQYELKYSLAMYSASLMTLFMLSTIPQFVLIAMYGLIGVFFGQGYRQNRTSFQLVFGTTVFTMLINIITIYIFGGFFGISLQDELISLINVLPFLNMNSAQIAYYVIILLGSLLEAVVIYLMCQILFSYLRMKLIVRHYWWQYPQSPKEKIVLLILIVGLSSLNFIKPNVPILLIITGLISYFIFLLAAAFVYQLKRK